MILESSVQGNSAYYRFSLDGKLIGHVPNAYGIPSNISPVAKAKHGYYKLLGMWNDNYVFYGLTGEDVQLKTFVLVNRKGQAISKNITKDDNTTFGDSYFDPRDSHMKIRNNKLYVLGRRGKSALITEVLLTDLFIGK